MEHKNTAAIEALEAELDRRTRELDGTISTLRALMAKLADLLDEDHFASCEEIVRKAGIYPPPEGEAEKLQTAIYRLCCIEDSDNLNDAEKSLIRKWIADLRAHAPAPNAEGRS